MEYEGSLDAPPIILTRRRDVMLVATGFAALFAVGPLALAILAWQAGPGLDPHGWLWEWRVAGPLFAVLVGPMFVTCLINLADPPTLRLSPEGIRYRGRMGVQTWRWREITRMWLYRPTTSNIMFSYAPGRKRTIRDLMNSTAGGDGGIPGGWPVAPQALLDLLSQAARRWEDAAQGPAVGDPDAADRQTNRIELVQSRVGSVVGFLTMPLVFMGVFSLSGAGFSRGAFVVFGILLVAMVPLCHNAVWPDKLVITRDGVTFVQCGLSRRMGWTYGNFRVWSYSRMGEAIGFEPLKPGAWPAFVARFAKYTSLGAIPDGWNMPTERLVDRLNAAQARWAGTVAAEPIVH